MTGILLVHGAWHGPWCWNDFVNHLTERGHDVRGTARAYQTEAEIFPGMGHDVMLDTDWRKVADRIDACIQDTKRKERERATPHIC